jgi:hypothetical protein
MYFADHDMYFVHHNRAGEGTVPLVYIDGSIVVYIGGSMDASQPP